MTRAPRLVVITDPRWDDARVVAVAEAVCAAVAGACVQLRDKQREDREVLGLATRLREVTSRFGAALIVNRRLRVAAECGADGAHVPIDRLEDARRELGPRVHLSCPAHTDRDVEAACDAGAGMVLVSPIFATPGKGPARGTEALARARSIAGGRATIVALGGVDEDNASSCFAAGADAVAAIRALFDALDPAATARRMADGAVVC